MQERIVREAAAKNGWPLCVIRPGMIYGRDNLWNAFCGLEAGKRLWLRTGALARLPLTYVENVAEAIVLAAEKPESAGQTLNVVDDDLPSRRRYVKLLQQHWPHAAARRAGAVVVDADARPLGVADEHAAARRPGEAAGHLHPLPARTRGSSRCGTRTPAIKRVLGWTPRYDLETAVKRSLGEDAPRRRPARRSRRKPAEAARENAAPGGGYDASVHGVAAEPQLRIAYMTGEYPRATDTFIQREVAALRHAGRRRSRRFPSACRRTRRTSAPSRCRRSGTRSTCCPPRPLRLIAVARANCCFARPAGGSAR